MDYRKEPRHPDSQVPYIYANNDAGDIYMSFNYFETNSDPKDIYTNFETNQYFILDLEPDYSSIKIGEKTNVTATLKLDNGKYYTNYELLPDIFLTFNVNGQEITKQLINGKASVEFNQSNTRGSYVVSVKLGNCTKIADIDVGKNYSDMTVQAEDIYYGDTATFNMNVSGNLTHQPTGQISIIIDGQKYTTNIKNSKATMNIEGMIPKTYDLIIRYEGDEDYCKSIFHKNYTVHKKPTQINMTIDEINYGEQGIIKITTNPTKLSTQAYLYITNENNQTTRKTVYIRNGTELKLKNYAAGEYNLTIQTWENQYYQSTNATAIFRVNKFPTKLTINATDINAGENAYINITLTPEGEVAGEANLTINNHTETIYLKNGQNTITINNVQGGTYHITVTYPGDKKYAPSTATTTFTAKKQQSNITAKIENNTLYINTTPNTTGLVLIYINNDKYEINLTNSQITLPIKFTKAQNNIFIYYQGDNYYNYSITNLTYEYEELINLTGYDETFYTTQNQSYYITLTDEEGYGIPNKTITIKINKETYEINTANDGSILLKLN